MTQSPDQKDALMQAALAHVPFDGMNQKALLAGARDIDLPPAAVKLHFPRAGVDLAASYHRDADARLREDLAARPPQGRFSEKVAEAVWRRLELVEIPLVRAGAATLALHQGLAATLVWETADAIWDSLGDTSRDVNWYTKRATLAGVIAPAVLYWLGDNSPDQADTRNFIDRRIEGVMQIEKLKSRAKKLPGMSSLLSLATGWIHAPAPATTEPTPNKPEVSA